MLVEEKGGLEEEEEKMNGWFLLMYSHVNVTALEFKGVNIPLDLHHFYLLLELTLAVSCCISPYPALECCWKRNSQSRDHGYSLSKCLMTKGGKALNAHLKSRPALSSGKMCCI